MLSACATDRYDELIFSFFDIVWYEEIDHICQLVQKYVSLFKAHHIILNLSVETGLLLQLINIKWIRQKPHVENKVCVLRDAMLKAKGHDIDHQTVIGLIADKDSVELCLQLPREKICRVDDIVCCLLDTRKQCSLPCDSTHKITVKGQRMDTS